MERGCVRGTNAMLAVKRCFVLVQCDWPKVERPRLAAK
jgi:hypothetical protein